MFTGIVEAVGRIVATATRADGARLVVDSSSLDISDVAPGDSIAVNGCCLTVVAKETRKDGARIAFDVSSETLRCTVGLTEKGDVNLEKAMRLSDRLGGHLVTGHIDGVGTVVSFAPVPMTGQPKTDSDQPSWMLEVHAPVGIAKFIAVKGSIAVQGVSLTVNAINGARFQSNIIPHTLEVTTLKALKPGARVNLEVDLIARYIERLATGQQ